MHNDKKGYPWFYLDIHNPWLITLSITLLIMLLGAASFVIYSHISFDTTPDSLAGYTYAIIAVACMILAAILHTLTRRSHKRKVGTLNLSLHWHIALGVLALFFVFLHSFGNFNPRTGTYALYGIIALVISGFIGRTIDRFVPRLITREVSRALTEAGEDRVEAIVHNIQSLVTYNNQQVRTTRNLRTTTNLNPPLQPAYPHSIGGSALPSSWDLAYISLAETPQETDRNSQQYRFVPDRKSPLSDSTALIPGMQDSMNELAIVQKALQREQFYRALIRYWRVFHILLVITTIGLTLWHLEYAAQLLIPTYFHH